MTKKNRNELGITIFHHQIVTVFILMVLGAFQSYRFCFLFNHDNHVEKFPPYLFEVKGDVLHPGLYFYGYFPTMRKLLSDCGLSIDENAPGKQKIGATLANGSSLWVQKARNGMRVVQVPLEGKKKIILEIPLDLNTATVEDLSSLPGIGLQTAFEIVLFRKTCGSFANIEEIKEVRGIGEKRFKKIRKYLSVTTEAVS